MNTYDWKTIDTALKDGTRILVMLAIMLTPIPLEHRIMFLGGMIGGYLIKLQELKLYDKRTDQKTR